MTTRKEYPNALNAKKKALQKIASYQTAIDTKCTCEPTVNKFIETMLNLDDSERKAINARLYLYEIKEIESLINEGATIHLLSKSDFDRLQNEADIVEEIYFGQYIQISEISKFPYNPEIIVYTSPISKL